MDVKCGSLEAKLADLRRQAFEGPTIKGREQLQAAEQAIEQITHRLEV